MSHRISIKFGGESGQGINTLGKLLSKSFKLSGFPIFAYREYPSLIKGGYASYQVDVAEYSISSSSKVCDILAVLDNDSMHEYLRTVKDGAFIIYDDNKIELVEEDKLFVKEHNIKVVYLDTIKIAKESGGAEIMKNMVMLGYIWGLLGMNIQVLSNVVRRYFSIKKNIDIEAEIKSLEGGFKDKTLTELQFVSKLTKPLRGWEKSIILSGNDALTLGAITAGCRAYFAYPMTPASSILKVLGDTYKDTGILIKQAENEITAAQMTLGSMYMGTRALTATSGGGFDLMTETISCAGMSETPLVVVLAQRIGPGTGVPTWTGAGDLNAAVKSGHGEFPRCVISVSDVSDSFILIQKAFNIAEEYQLPVIILTEKQIAESLFNTKDLPKGIKIDRHLKRGNQRYEITTNGISPRWIPNKSNTPYLATSDEHDGFGISIERGEDVFEMMEKRLRKMQTLTESIPEPEYFGSENPESVFVGYGSVKNTILDVIAMGKENIGYLHYKYIFPLKTDYLLKLYEDGARLITVENNQSGEFSNMIKEECGFEIPEKILKFDGRPFFVEDILDYINS